MSRQRGSALLIALIAAALAAVIAASVLERAQRSLATTEALLATERSWQYADGMAVLAERMLRQALADGLDASMASGGWTVPFEVPGGHVQGRLIDLGGRFNVNALASPDAATALFARQAFGRLLDALGLNPVIADELADWLDGSLVGRAGGAGSDWYARQLPPYRAAGTLLLSTSELRWLRSVDAQAWQVLAPVVAAVPDARLRLNVNAATPELLAALVVELDVAEAARVIADGPYGDLAQLLGHPLLQGRANPQEQLHLSATSSWYLAQARVRLDGVERDYFRLMNTSGAGYDEFRFFSQGVP